jgi:hypothetical protein
MPERVEKRPISKVQTINLVFQDDSWNCPLPAANNHEFATVRPIMIGSSLRDGFKAGDTKK